ncbi:MAG: hypothetical protein ABFD92_02800 [Planctomycetaceae bacterium]|nr:hypothetical protein [Planctomycetaceae bacterium]
MLQNKKEPFDHPRGLRPLLRKATWGKTALPMTISAVLFAAVCAFQQYLTSGRWINFSAMAYLQDVKKPIGHILLNPLPVLQYPWMILITGLILAILVFVPVIVAVLYHLRFAAIFIVIQAVVSHTPVLAMVSAVGCLLAARTRLRSEMPFVAAILGLIPAAAYLHLMGYLGLNTATVMSLQRWVLYAPFLVATVAAVLACGMVLTLASLTGFRPGVIWPVLLALTAAPVTLFYTQVRADELDYRLLIEGLPAGDALLETRKFSDWLKASNAQGLTGQTLENQIESDLKAQRSRIFQSCKQFLESHPASRRAPEILWVQAQGMSLQVDRQAMAAGLLAYTSTWPLQGSASDFTRLVQSFPSSQQAALARLQLAQLDLRNGKADAAIEHLLDAQKRLAAAVLNTRPEAREADIFVPKAVLPSTTYLTDRLFSARRLIAVIQQGGVVTRSGTGPWQVDPQAAAALGAFLQVDPFSPEYRKAMRELAVAHAASSLGPFLRLQAAKADLATPGQPPAAVLHAAKDLQALASARPLDYLSAEANYALGRLHAELPPDLEGKLQEREYYEIVAQGPVSFWARMAGDALASMAPDDVSPGEDPTEDTAATTAPASASAPASSSAH